MKIKAVFFDIDGTLISSKDGLIPEDTRFALRHLKETGIRIFTATGRHLKEICQLPVRTIPFDGYVLLNGQLCLDGNGKRIHDFAIDRGDIENILPIVENNRLPISFVEQERLYINYIDERVVTAQKAIFTELPETGSYRGDAVYLVNLFSGEEDAKQLLAHMPHCTMTRWNPCAVDIVPAGGGKQRGIQSMFEYFGIAPEEALAFGDGENDVEMLKFCKNSVAMGNADACAKECADYVTLDIDAGGISAALRHYGLL